MRTVFDWQAFGGCIGGLIVLALGGIACILPAIVAGLIILAIPVALWYVFKEMFFKKVE